MQFFSSIFWADCHWFARAFLHDKRYNDWWNDIFLSHSQATSFPPIIQIWHKCDQGKWFSTFYITDWHDDVDFLYRNTQYLIFNPYCRLNWVYRISESSSMGTTFPKLWLIFMIAIFSWKRFDSLRSRALSHTHESFDWNSQFSNDLASVTLTKYYLDISLRHSICSGCTHTRNVAHVDIVKIWNMIWLNLNLNHLYHSFTGFLHSNRIMLIKHFGNLWLWIAKCRPSRQTIIFPIISTDSTNFYQIKCGERNKVAMLRKTLSNPVLVFAFRIIFEPWMNN